MAFPTSTQGALVIPNALAVSTFTGAILADGVTVQSVPSAVSVEGHLFRLDHVALNNADGATATLENGFKLDFAQLPCSFGVYGVTP